MVKYRKVKKYVDEMNISKFNVWIKINEVVESSKLIHEKTKIPPRKISKL